MQNLLETRYLYSSMERLVEERTQELAEAKLEVIERLALAAEYRDDDTGQHVLRVASLTAKLAQLIGQSDEEVELIFRASRLHDVGKIAIPDSILLKPGKLTNIEFDLIKTHTTKGSKILAGSNSTIMKAAQRIALSHHERWDGLGYPNGLEGEAIPIEGRLVSIADTFDALRNERPYKEAWSLADTVAEIKKQSGRQFDPRLVEAFLTLVEESDVEQAYLSAA